MFNRQKMHCCLVTIFCDLPLRFYSQNLIIKVLSWIQIVYICFLSILCLTFTGLPSVEIILVIDACNFITFNWITTAHPVCGNVSYTVRLLDDGEVVMMDATMETSYNFTGLNGSVNYSINVTATNNAGDSDPVTVQTGMSSSRIVIIRQSMYDCTNTIMYIHVGTAFTYVCVIVRFFCKSTTLLLIYAYITVDTKN